MRKRKKGVSEVVAAMLLITIAVAASVLFYIYSSGLLGSLLAAQPQSGQYSNQITLEFYDWTNTVGGVPQCSSSLSSCQTLTLTLRNIGSGLGILAAFYVSGNKVTSALSGSCTTYTTTALNPHNSCTVTLTITGLTIVPGVSYLVKVVTKDGGVFAYSCIAGHTTGS